MKKKTNIKKLLMVLLAVVLVIGGVPFEAQAATVALHEEDLIIPQKAAEYIVGFFVQHVVNMGQTRWTEETAVVNSIPMYDETGENITAYGVNLTEGYVIVSAYADMPNPFLEWADEGEPVYAAFANAPAGLDLSGAGETKVMYLGGMDYYLDVKDSVVDVEGETVDRDALSNDFREVRDIENVPENLLDALKEDKLKDKAGDGIAPLKYIGGGEIADPYEYARYWDIGSTWKAIDWKNNWEDHTRFVFVRTDTYRDRYDSCCGPVAIANALRMYGNKYNASSIKSKTNESLFFAAIATNNYAGGYYYTNAPVKDGGGVAWEKMGYYAQETFGYLNINISLYGEYNPTYWDIHNASAGNKLMLVNIKGHTGLSEAHVVVGYACCRIKRTDSGDDPRNPKEYGFLKAIDGRNTTARYYDVDTMLALDDKFYELYFG